jgi:hypothetical protein
LSDRGGASLGEVLAAIATCRFDVAEYVHSTAHGERLRRADRAFGDGSAFRPRAVLASDIVETVRGRFASQVPGYRAHAAIERFADFPQIDKREVIEDRFRYVNATFDVARL